MGSTLTLVLAIVAGVIVTALAVRLYRRRKGRKVEGKSSKGTFF